MEIRNLSRLIGLQGTTKADIEALSGTLEEIAFAYAEETDEIGVYINGAWSWTGGADASASVGHLHGIARLSGDGSTTTFELPDLAEYIESLTDNGSEVDPALYALSGDLSQVVFTTAPAAAHLILVHYVIWTI